MIVHLNLAVDHVEYCQSLLDALHRANELDGYFARAAGGAWGDVYRALVTSLACAIAGSRIIYFADARAIAETIVDSCISNGDGVMYNIALWNAGVLA